MAKPLKLALVYWKEDPGPRRAYGRFSYRVPEFDVTPYKRHKNWELELHGYDVAFYEDQSCVGDISTEAPICFHILDSGVSEGVYQETLRAIPNKDLVLVDYDELERFRLERFKGIPVRRLSHAVNDRVFYDYGFAKTIDVGCFVAKAKSIMNRQLLIDMQEFCAKRGYTYDRTRRDLAGYAQTMNRTKICINIPTTLRMRSHRVLDAMACRTCLLTMPVPDLEGEKREAGTHYLEFCSWASLTQQIDDLLHTGQWEQYAKAGYQLIREHHTWAVRAQELRQIMADELGI